MTGAWLALVSAYGGVFSFARWVNVSPGTVWRWARGQVTPGPNTRSHVASLAKRAGLGDPWNETS